MALYGTGPNPVTQLLINGTWTDVSSRPRASEKIIIKRGRQNEQGNVTAQTCQTTLNNRDGVLSNRNPNSPYYGLLPRNTRMRVLAGSGDVFFKAPWSDNNTATRNLTTADKASLRITGDIDIRADIWPYTWRSGIPTNSSIQGMTIASRGTSSGNLSWVFYMLGDGTLKFRWYTDGTTSGAVSAISTTPVPVPSSGRLSVRVTLDVDNGAAGNTVTFYTGSSVTGTWTQLGSTVVQSGTTSIFAGTANIVFAGGGDGFPKFFSDISAFGGKFYRGQIYSGIGGTLVADVDVTSRSIGDTSWTDTAGTPNTWNVTSTDGFARVTSHRVRFTGELSSLPQVWDITGKDVTVPVTASGMIRRLTQGASPLDSPMYRNFNQYNPAGYWPLEDGSLSTQAASPVDSVPAAVTTAVTFGNADSTLPGASSVAAFQDATSRIQFTCPRSSSTGTASFVFYVKLDSLPASSKTLATLYTSGTAAQIRVALSPTTWDLTFVDSNGTTLVTNSTGITNVDPSKGWIGFNLLLQTSGSDMTWSARFDAVSTFGGGVGPNTISGGKVGVPLGGYIASTNDTAYNTAKTAQWFMSTGNFDLSNDTFRKASSAYTGETAGARLIRLASEQGIPLELTGIAADSEPMGYQLIDTFMANVYDCAETDGGILGESRDLLALTYRTRTSLENRSDITFDYSQSPFDGVPLPTEDDQAFTNDVTVTRPGGSSARVQRTDGATSVSDPPSGVGRYATAVTRNAATDSRLASIAGWMVIVGSWDDARYPTLPIGLHRTSVQGNATLTAQIMALELGDTGTLTNLPSWLPPDPVPEIVQGYTETLDKFTWSISLNATPAGAYAVPVLGSDISTPRADATSHTLGASLTTTATSISLVTPAGSAVWVDSTNYPAEFPFNIKVAGEVMTLTAISGTASPQTGTAIRSVNGVVKSHSSGEPVRLATPFYVGR